MPLPPIVLTIYLLMLPVTGMVPVLRELTLGRYPQLGDFEQHLFMAANMFGALLFVPIAGLLSDWWRRRKAIIVAALAVNALSLLMLTLNWDYSIYLLWRFVEGCAHITSLSLLMALAVDHVRQRGTGGAMGLVGAAVGLGVASGAPLGGFIGEQQGAEQVLQMSFWLLGGLTLFALLLLRDRPAQHTHQRIGALLRALPQNRRLLLPYTFAFVDRLTVGFIVSTLSLYLSNVIGLGAAAIGMVMALFLIPFSLLTYPAGLLSQRWNPLLMMLGGSAAYGIMLIAIGFAPGGAIGWLMFAGGVTASLMYAPSLVLVADLSRPEHKALAMSGFNFAGSLGFVLGPLSGGALLALFSHSSLPAYPMAFAIIGGLEVLCALLFLPLALRESRAPA
ncbi:MFS transporter [Thiohalophilus thiocyanatoxydans]|uniref:Putative MFS family arabinose efflux permease n=1 Tax=Thiohalophilus thiocyanatoxydans TaxID=381308 RepID=A0A4R8IIS5_9GAMM|nr:MFS transporter [Thiohalophilus thiocyanatoxydans]TDY00571.1 putative MFS family arabinose efflux permease [Thiohalophilus thiocyanatoxydans]